ncbi:MAG: NAD(P)-dependent oxidoreductase [Sphingomonadales bacterium]|nr:NAD(P)-dependent oxidoreductase [Sphingomonadales bacterium]
MTRIAFIGLGVMGAPMARHLIRAGHDLTVYNRSRAKAENWATENGGSLAASPADAAKDAEVVISCVGTDDDLAGVTLGRNGAFAAMAKGSLYIDHTTVSARIARQLGVEAKSRGLLIVDAPVTGGQAGAENGTLSIMCGGTEASVDAARAIIAAYSKRIVHVGGPGTGQITKMCNQIAFAGVIQSLSEALRFAQSAELDVEKVYEAISGGAAQSWQMDNRWATMAQDKYENSNFVCFPYPFSQTSPCLEAARHAGEKQAQDSSRPLFAGDRKPCICRRTGRKCERHYAGPRWQSHTL